jgi:DNA-binding LacI/PurR family transcriptional regulator
MGYRNVLIITGRNGMAIDSNSIDLLKSVLKSKEEMNKPVIVEIDELNYGNEIDFGQIEKYLRPPYSIEVIIALHAETIYQIMTTFRRKKVRIPQDVALISMEEGIGFDLLYSPVTCLRKPMTGMALKVANMIWTEVKNAGKSKYKRQVNLSPELIIRNSCGTI